jgi:hypothetical protein
MAIYHRKGADDGIVSGLLFFERTRFDFNLNNAGSEAMRRTDVVRLMGCCASLC